MRRLIFTLCMCVVSSLGNAACYKSQIMEPQPFLGNGGEVFILTDGTIWRNMTYAYLYLYAYYPNVVICPDKGKMGLGDAVFDVVRMK